MIHPERLELLVQLHELSTMRAVADANHMSVSSVSQQISALERVVGSRVTEKVGRRVRLTPLGEELVALARPVLGSLREIEDVARGESREVRGHLRVASFTSALGPRVVPVAAGMSQDYPDLDLTLAEMEPDQSIPLVRAGQVDIAVSAGFGGAQGPDLPDLVTVPVTADPLCAVLPQGHPSTGSGSVPLSELRSDRWILEPDTTYLAAHVRLLTEQAGFEPRCVATLMSYHGILSAVSRGIGVTVLPRLATRDVPADVVVLPLEPQVQRSIFLVTTDTQLTRLSSRTLVSRVGREAKKLG